MKIHRILFLLTTVVIPQLAQATLPFSNEVFGKIEGTFDYCARVDSQAASRYQERKKAMVRDVPEKEVAEARGTKEYKDAYESMSGELAKVPKDQAVAACKASLDDK